MAIMDDKLVFSDSQSVACASGASIYSTNIIDLGVGQNFFGAAKALNPGQGNSLNLNVICEDTDWTKTGDGTTCTLELIHGSANNGTAITTNAAVLMSKTLTITDCDDGDQLWNVPLPADATYQYLQLKITTPADAAIAAGKMTAWLGSPMGTPESMK
ncbi:MAG: hypothetical protein RDU24_08815 [Humidesulfovibrio sp.]|uniref:hypothetical protein n=1 Tax=Humidesulfovibrio sp. TaxID=2910988 RepID=UPI0027ED193E|nr:hypothetical protein [Humidesulfovibrio sp.]MDQ7835469.1 hypothetical protein [Humidesulfovibrio sp.]